jgi:Cu+-exporting ATPase
MTETNTDTTTLSETEIVACYHCGQPCRTGELRRRDHDFCCEGCAVVYELLADNGMESYYELEKNPGISLRKPGGDSDYAFLDVPEIREKILDSEDVNNWRVTLEIPAIHCASCVWLLENMHRLEPGILMAQVNFQRKEVSYLADASRLTLRQLVERLHALGYTPRLSLDATEKRKTLTSQEDRAFLYRLAVAGFCFGNIMLLSFPEYLDLDIVREASFRRFFGWINLALAFPVFFYSASAFFRPAWTALRHGVVNIDVPLAVGIIVMFVRSAAEIITGSGAGFMDALAGLVFLLLVGRWFQNKSFEALSFERRFKSYFPLSARRVMEEGVELVSLDALRPEDVVVLKNEELIPADGEVLEGRSLIDYSFVTGESFPVLKNPGDKVYAGGRNTGGLLKIKLLKSVSQSYLTSLWNSPVFQKEKSPFLSSRTNVVSKYFTIAQLLIAGGGASVWLTLDPSKALHVFTSVLIITCPCALALTVPFTLGNSLRLLGRRKFYLKNADVIETLAKVDTVVLDKTGTLTLPDQKNVVYTGEVLPSRVLALIARATSVSTHPLSVALHQHLGRQGVEDCVEEVQEIPGKGLVCGALRLGSAAFLGIQEQASDGFGLAGGAVVYVEWEGKVLGRFEILNAFREEVSLLSREIKKLGMKTVVLSGDHDRERPVLERLLGNDVRLIFEQKPEDKLNYIRTLQQEGHTVLMVGDGLNDAGALRQADVGVALTEENGTFFPASDAMLRASALGHLPAFIRQARNSMLTVKWSFLISLFYNSIGLYYALSGSLQPVVAAVLMPISSVTVIAFTVGISSWYGWRNGLWGRA